MKNSKGKIYQYSSDGTFMKEFENTLDVEYKLKIQNSTLSNHLNNKSKHCHGYFFSRIYYLKYPTHKLLKKPNSKMMNFETELYSYDCDGNFLKKYNKIKDVSERKDVRNWVRACLKGENKTYNNKIWLFDYYEKMPEELLNKILNKKIVHLDINGRVIEIYKNVSDASRKTGLATSSISLVATGKRNSVFGHRFIRYKEYKTKYGNI